ncbi:MAG: [protein-PII] uridylyltransferase [bacterium]
MRPGGSYPAAREELLGRPVGGSWAARRRALSALTDAWLEQVFALSGASEYGCALVAVGGYGREELAAGSDLDLLLLVPDRPAAAGGDLAGVADSLWYPIWDSGVRLDHSVRTLAETRRMAAEDVRVILGLLDMRCVTGDRDLAHRVREATLADWRSLAPARLPLLRESVAERRARHGDLAHLIEPDLKESYGGLRDVTILRALAASWVADVPHDGIADARASMLDVRDALHEQARSEARRASDILRLQDQDEVAERLSLGDADALLRDLSDSARTVAYACDVAWHRVDRLSRRRPSRPLRRRWRRTGPERTPLADGAVVSDGEVVLALDARPDRDPVVALRLAAAAAQAGLAIAPATLQRLAAETPPMPVPWPPDARDALVSLLGSGAALADAWEGMDRVGLVGRLIPEWGPVRSAPQRNPLHIYRVDRHLVETAAHATAFLRDVARPDLLLVSALFHDIGKGRPGDHTEVGVRLMAGIGPALGFDSADTEMLVALVRNHLLLPEAATRRDLDDPATVAGVAAAVGDQRTLDLLHALTKADALATGPAAWSEWKAGLIDELVRRTRAVLAGEALPAAPDIAQCHPDLLASPGLQVRITPGSATTRVLVVADDRRGLLGDIAGVLALHRLEVRAADTQTVGARALSSWAVHPLYGEPPPVEQVRGDLQRVFDGTLDVTERLAARGRPPAGRSIPARVDFVSGAAAEADVLEVRAHDEPGLLHRLGNAIAEAGAFITAARVATLGSEVVDAFYLRRPDGVRLQRAERAHVVATVLDVLVAGPD